MGALRESQICPKRDRCRHDAECIHQDTFRGEYLCFDSKATNIYELERQRYMVGYQPKAKKGERI